MKRESVPVAVVGIVLGLAACGLLFVALSRVSPNLRAAQRAIDQKNFEGVQYGIIWYANEHDGRLPPAVDWESTLVEFGSVSWEMLRSPPSDDSGASYHYVPSDLLTQDPSQVLIFSDPSLNGGQGGRVGYHDGHSEWLNKREFYRVISALTLPDGTPWAPHLDD